MSEERAEYTAEGERDPAISYKCFLCGRIVLRLAAPDHLLGHYQEAEKAAHRRAERLVAELARADKWLDYFNVAMQLGMLRVRPETEVHFMADLFRLKQVLYPPSIDAPAKRTCWHDGGPCNEKSGCCNGG